MKLQRVIWLLAIVIGAGAALVLLLHVAAAGPATVSGVVANAAGP